MLGKSISNLHNVLIYHNDTFSENAMVNEENHQSNSGFIGRLLTNTFLHPRGMLGRLGGSFMARSNRVAADWIINLLEIQPSDCVLEVGFGPGVALELLSKEVTDGKVTGVDISQEMVSMATKRNQEEITSGKVELKQASVMTLPYEDNQFGKALSINSMHLWPNVETGLKEVYRVMQPSGIIALGFTPRARLRLSQDEIIDMLEASGFKNIRIKKKEGLICVLGET